MNESWPLPTDECDIWPGYTGSDGYGRCNRKGRGHSPQLAHRWAYEQAHGPIPEGMVVMHLCDNRSCVKPTHLALGTQSENLRMAYARGMPPRGFAARR